MTVHSFANERVYVAHEKDLRIWLKKRGLNDYLLEKNFKALLKYNQQNYNDNGILVSIPPLKCLDNIESPIAYCGKGVTRSFTFLADRFKNGERLDIFFEEYAKKKPDFKMLEIGFGVGVLLAQAQVLYPHSRLTGINYEPIDNVRSSKELGEVAVFHKLCSELLWEKLPNKPELIFKDLDNGELSWIESRSVDFVVSQSTIQYLSSKDTLLKEIVRILRPGGRAYLHIRNIRLDNHTTAESSFKEFFSQIQKSNPDFKVVIFKNFLVRLERPMKSASPELKIPFLKVKSIHVEKLASKGALFNDDSTSGQITFFQKI